MSFNHADLRVYHIGCDNVHEAKLSRNAWRRMSQTERDESGLREGEMLKNAEEMIFDVVKAYLKRGGSRELVNMIVNIAVAEWLREGGLNDG